MKCAKSKNKVLIMSILTLNTVVEKHRDVLLPVYTIILFNHFEERNIRIAALSMILKAKPSFSFMQRLAVSTWHENDPEMAKFIFYISFVHRAIKFLFWRRIWDTDHKNGHKVWFDICTSFEVLCKSEKGLKNNIDFNNTYTNSLS